MTSTTTEDIARTQPVYGAAWPSPWRGWYVTVLVMASYFIAYVDRSVVNLLIEPMKADIGLSDVEISLIVGLSFAIFFALAGIPLGRLADSASRKWVISFSIIAWSAMTALSGFSRGFLSLFACRVGVGVGEAGLNPSAMSIISDHFAPDKRQLPLTLYIISGVVGAGMAVIVGAGLLALGEALAANSAILPGLRPWQWVFILVALPGVPLALLFMLTVKEPQRRGAGGEILSPSGAAPLREVFSYFRDRWRCFVPLLLGPSIILTVNVGFLVWGIPLAQRAYGLEVKDAAVIIGFPMFLSGIAGNFIGTAFARYLTKRGYADGMLRAMLIITTVSFVPVVIAPLMPNTLSFVLLLAPFLGMLAATVAIPQIAFQLIVPNRLRGQTVSIFYFVINVLSYSAGPTLVALITDGVFADESKLNFSLMIVSAIAFPIAIFLFRWGLPHFGAEAKRQLGDTL